MNELVIDPKEELVMKLLHYFITEQGYNPIVLHGAKDEIWLENLDNDYKIVRIVSNYIHNMEQFDYDTFKTKQILKQIKKKTFTFNVNTLSIYTDIGDNVKLSPIDNIDCIYIKDIEDIDKYDILKNNFPDLKNDLNMKEKGIELFTKLTGDINNTNEKKAEKVKNIFEIKKPIVTYILLGINILIYILMTIFGHDNFILLFGLHREAVLAGQYYRLFTCMFLHANLIHLIFNMYALNIIGSQIENFFGKTKYLFTYIFSGLIAGLMSMIFTRSWSVGASGAIFGLLGALLYFGYHYRMYLGTVIKSQILPIIIANLAFGFLTTGIDNAAHIGGLIGGIIGAMMCGVKEKSDTSDKINGIVIGLIFTLFLIYIAFIYIK
ncbi:MAG: rhomboid family intramembrane serine protease [Firmicutes bacterium]|nr:rhomboid family intramembrane serine protease [Bacillota bacterium]